MAEWLAKVKLPPKRRKELEAIIELVRAEERSAYGAPSWEICVGCKEKLENLIKQAHAKKK